MKQAQNKIEIYKRKVKYLRLEVKLDGVKVILPENFQGDLRQIIEKHQNWIEKKQDNLVNLRNLALQLRISENPEWQRLIEKYIKEVGDKLKITPLQIKFRHMKNKWGCCNLKNKIITLNRFVKYLPNELIRYLVIHELCHFVFPNHRKEFWLLVKKFIPDFLQKEKLLSAYKIVLN